MKLKSLLLIVLVAKFCFAQQFNTALCWKVTAPSSGTENYLYGTIHVTDERVYTFTDSLSSLIDSCQVFALELDPSDFNFSSAFELFKADTSLKDLLSKHEYILLDSVCRSKLGFSADIIQFVKPIFVAILLTEDFAQASSQEFLDLHLSNIAKAKNKELVGLELLEEQLAAIDKIPLSYQVEMLLESLRDDSSSSALMPELDPLIQSYLEGDTISLMDSFEEEGLPEEFEEAMLVIRNQKMAERFHKIAQEKSLFAAVGAAHLYGRNGLLQLLRDKGYKVENVPLKKGP